MALVFLAFGVMFGFLLSRAGATGYDYYAQLFLFEDLQLLWVIASAVTVGITGILLLKRSGLQSIADKRPIEFQDRPYRSGLILGALLFGIGWGTAGACPGSAFAMLGEGKLAALPTMVGIALGTWIYALGHETLRGIDHPLLRSALPPGTWLRSRTRFRLVSRRVSRHVRNARRGRSSSRSLCNLQE